MNNIIKALNLTEGSVLTLEKMQDRMEFEAIMAIADSANTKNSTCAFDVCKVDVTCGNCWDICSCVGANGYINCHPYK